MNWKKKARIQNIVASLPGWLAMPCYYAIQRRFGALRTINPTSRLQAGVDTWDRIVSMGKDPRGGTFFEIGTGRMVSAPMAFWLMGAERTITVDLNPYLKRELVQESLNYVREHHDHVAQLFGERLLADRFDTVCDLASREPTIEEVLSTLAIEYRSPADASNTGLPNGCVDFHTSYTVLEHIPPTSLLAILREAQRITNTDGLLVHGIDYTDHFSHDDSSISAIHFLRYNQQNWDRFADNRFMYMNRLRHSDYLSTFQQAGFELASNEPLVDESLLAELEAGSVPLDETYQQHDATDLATTSSWIVCRLASSSAMVA